MGENENDERPNIDPNPATLQREIDRLNRELRAFVAVALRHGLRDYEPTAFK